MPEENELLVALQQLADDLGRPPTSRDVREHGEFGLGVYRSTFGSWSAALAAAGFDADRSGTRYDTEDLLAELRRLADELGGRPTIEHLRERGRYSVTPYRDRFGSWTNALEEAGVWENTDQSVTDENALDELRRLADDLGHAPSRRDLDDHGQYSVSLYRNRFGSWSDALEAAGLEPPSKGSRISKEGLLADLQRLSRQQGERPTLAMVREYGKFSTTTYLRRFDSWIDALRAAGFDTDYNRLSDEALLEDVQELAEKLGHPPTLQEFRDHSEHSATTYYERFGSWRETLNAAGFEDRPPQQAIPRDELIAELRRLAEELDTAPSRGDMKEHGAYHPDTYVRRFGSWQAALDMFD